jgi:hypothetical protein
MILDLVKPGGKIIIGMRRDFLRSSAELNWPYEMDAIFKWLEREKKWSLMSKQIQSITEDTDGCYLCFEKI